MTRYSKFLFGVSVTLLGLFLILGRKNSNTLPFIEPLGNGSFYCSLSDTVFGIDVSHHNGIIDWETLKLNHPEIEFAYIRCVVGPGRVDNRYLKNIQGAKRVGIKTGAYVYYYANRNSTSQFGNFKNHVLMSQHELVPVLDIEKPSKYGPDNLRKGLANWLELVENEYGVRPALYSNLGYFEQYLIGYFNDYSKWIAAYSRCPSNIDWDIHQFSEEGRFKGIDGFVDMNYCSRSSFNKFLIAR